MTGPNRRPPHYGARQTGQIIPDRLYMEAPGFSSYLCHAIALDAVAYARRDMPKFTGAGARSLQATWGPGFFGIRWDDPYVWHQETGIFPFTMKRLAGKTIPMWIKDPTGEERRKNPKAEVRMGADGVERVLVFRRAAKMGQRKTVSKVVQGQRFEVTSPMSYPGAPGRIAVRDVKQPGTRSGKIGGQIAGRPLVVRNVGVRWRHPGLTPRAFLHRGMVQAAIYHGLDEQMPIYATTERWR